ncbi:DUF3958 family protein [Bacillus toyonensis]|uniref:DUF3958 domain-containing protein n=1 Tax=Bacillus toyonensis TaxID=155322 RepID=A0A2B5XZ48_9BACI|nr:DUF3958 family protein [Bacillus toyonensis]PGB01597.1 hypothetical protein COL93_15560 [Bacillus toyonensis]PHD73338.1 hypothetical protein COF40_03800 [Bacillus toyonensis]
MSQDIEKQVDQLNQELRIVFEKQDRNQAAIQIQRQTEMDFHELRSRNNRLFNRVLETWHGDKEVSNFFINKLQESQHIECKLTFELENQKEKLFKERRDLSDLENNLTYRRQQLKGEDEA